MRFLPLDPDFIASVRAGGPDANGQPAENVVSDGEAKPCRCCLRNIAAGEDMLVLAARPFPEPQPYAEIGPIFLHAGDCTPWTEPGLPPVLGTSPDYLIKGYGPDHRIRYGTGAIVPTDRLFDEIDPRLARPDVAYVDVRSARNNCFLARAVRDPI